MTRTKPRAVCPIGSHACHVLAWLLMAAGSLAACPEAVEAQPAVQGPAPATAATHEGATAQPAATDDAATADTANGKHKRTLVDLLLFFPARHPAGNWQPEGLAFEDAWFRAEDSTRLHGWYCPAKDARAVVLYLHGNAGNLSHRARLLVRLQTQLHVTVLIFDYRGYGRSEGVPGVEGVLDDARAARNFLAKRAGVKPSDVVLMGRSLGGAVAVQLAAERPPRGLILESTFSSLKAMAEHHYPSLAWLVPGNLLDSVSQIAKYKGPLLASHGTADRTVPYASGMKLFRAAHDPKQLFTIERGDHNDPQPADYYRQLDRFLDALPAN